MATLTRQTFRFSRALEYFTEKELTLQTGHAPERWPEVVVKELVDNSLDACEEAGVAPDIRVTLDRERLNVADNGPGMAADLVKDVLDFSVRVSSMGESEPLRRWRRTDASQRSFEFGVQDVYVSAAAGEKGAKMHTAAP